MALVLKDRISETTTTTGTGTITLGGATPGFQPFSSIGDTNTTYYCVTSGAAWEVGIGTYASSGNTLARTTILANSNNNTSPITLGAGSKVVFSVYPADRAVVVNGTTIQIPNNAVLPVANGGTGSNTAAFSGANITDLNATAITAGTIANNRTTASSSNGASTIVQRDAAGDFSANIITANSYSGSGASLTSLNASSISSGTLGVARGGTGATTLNSNAVIIGNGTSAVTFVDPGTSANVLTSNGTSWVSQAPAAGGGDWTLVASTTIASGSSTSVDMTGIPTTQGSYWLVGRIFYNTDTGVGAINNWGIRFSTDNGASFIASSNAYIQSSAGTSFSLWNATFGADLPCALDFFAHMIQSDGSTVGAAIQGSTWRAYAYTGTLSTGTGTSQATQQGGTIQATAAAVNALRLLRISGGKTISGGYLRLYKMKFS